MIKAGKLLLIVAIAVQLGLVGVVHAGQLITFEEGYGHDNEVINDQYEGITFEEASSGYPWIYADPVHRPDGNRWCFSSWPSGQEWCYEKSDGTWCCGEYWMYGYVAAIADPDGGTNGRIRFLSEDATYVQLAYSARTDITFCMEAFNSANEQIAISCGPGNLRYQNNNLNGPGILRVEAPVGQKISYVEVHDTYNSWIIDNVETDATFVRHCPDLVVPLSGISYEPQRANPGDLVTLTATIQNVGIDPAYSLTVAFGYERTPFDPNDDPNIAIIGTQSIGSIAAGGSTVISQVWDTTGCPSTTIPLYIGVYGSDPAECDESNNVTSVDYTVPVELYSFCATPDDKQIALNWTTETEIGNLGWHIYRSTNPLGPYTRITATMIPGAGTSFSLHSYSHQDKTVENGISYFYYLRAEDSFGDRENSNLVTATPNKNAKSLPNIELYSNKSRLSLNDKLKTWITIQNPGTEREVTVHCWLELLGVGRWDVMTRQSTRLAANLDVTDVLMEHTLSGEEPAGDYLLRGEIFDPITGIKIDSTFCYFAVSR